MVRHWPGSLLAGRAVRGSGRGRAGRDRRALLVPAPLRQGGAVPAAVHVRAGPRPGRRDENFLGHPAEVAEPPAGVDRRVLALRGDDPLLQPVHHPPRPGHRTRVLVCAPANARRSLHPRRRARPRDAGRPWRERQRALHGRLRARIVPRRPGRRPHHADARDRPGDGYGGHRRSLRGRGDRRPRLLLGHVPRGPYLRPGAFLRHPLLPALLDLLHLRADGCRPDHSPVGPARETPQVIQRLPWALLVFVAAFFVPAAGSRYYTFLANDIVIWALFATSLNLLVGYTGLVSFGHAAYFGIGAYATGLLMKKAGVSFLIAFPAAGVVAGLCALVFGFFCVRLTRIYFAMLTLAFAQLVWAICFKWNEVTGGEQGMPEIPYPTFDWLDRVMSAAPVLGSYRTSDYYYFTCLVLIALCLWILRRIVASPFGRMLTTIRANAER